MSLFAEVAADVCEDAAAACAVEDVLVAADLDPALIQRTVHDPRMSTVAAAVTRSIEELEKRALDLWNEARVVTAEALQHCAPWMILADGKANDAFRTLETRKDTVEELAERGDPFARLEAVRQSGELAEETDALRGQTREAIAESLRVDLDRLTHVVEEAGPELKSSEEWVEAKVTVGECEGLLAQAEETDEDRVARECLESVRHKVGVQADLIDVISMEIARREKERSERRQYKEAEDRMVLRAQDDRQGIIHAQLIATGMLAGIFFWAGPLVIFTALPAAFALLSAQDARATLRERIWSIPRADVDAVNDAMVTRMIVAVLLITVVVIVLVIQWMLGNVR
jgi:hypothetical protein